jgi:ferredoxin-like protein FixX
MSRRAESDLQDKFYRTRYEPDAAHPHIKVNSDCCVKCETKPCLFFCPAEVYRRNPNDGKLITVSTKTAWNAAPAATAARSRP